MWGFVGDFEILHDKCYRGIPSSIKRGVRLRQFECWTVLVNRSIV